jgi:hypothetical protein
MCGSWLSPHYYDARKNKLLQIGTAYPQFQELCSKIQNPEAVSLTRMFQILTAMLHLGGIFFAIGGRRDERAA